MTDDAPCPTCGPQPPPHFHTICHPGEFNRHGCGHPLKEHTPSLRCRTCGTECGLDASRWYRQDR